MKTIEGILSEFKGRWNCLEKEDVIKAMKEYAIECIKECAERAKLNQSTNSWQSRWVDKQSILSLINEL